MKKRKKEKVEKKKQKRRARIRTIFISKQTMRKQAKLFSEVLKEPFVLKRSRETSYLTSPNMGNYMATNTLIPFAEVGYIRQVKEHIIATKKYEDVPKVSKSEVGYFKYNNKLEVGNVFKKCYEVDLSHAYWEIANDLGLLKHDIYVKASQINPDTDKPYIGRGTRLACIGALARRRRIYTFDGKKTTLRRERSPITRHIWDYISLQINKIMIKCSKAVKNDFIFFWSDAIFVTDKAALKLVSRTLDNAKRGYKVRKIQYIEVKQKGMIKYIYVEDGVDDPRTFPYAFG